MRIRLLTVITAKQKKKFKTKEKLLNTTQIKRKMLFFERKKKKCFTLIFYLCKFLFIYFLVT